jgi:ligand-binding SRPBCC domain-containing protein
MRAANHMTTHTFEQRSIIKTTMDAMLAFHQDAKTLGILTPPPIFVQLHRDTRTSLTDGELDFTLWIGFIPVRWLARHEPTSTANSFADRMIEGPMQSWLHQHLFHTVEGGVELLDQVTLSHKSGWRGLLSRLMFDGLPLRILFWYRHFRTRLALEKR